MNQNRVNKIVVFFLTITLFLGSIFALAVISEQWILAEPLTVEVEIITSLDDVTPPTVIADLDPIDVEDDKGVFKVSFTVTDDTDPHPDVTAILQIYLPANWQIDWEIDLKDDSKTKIEADYDDEEIEIKDPDSDKILNDLTTLGGFVVDNGQLLKIKLEDDEIKIELLEENNDNKVNGKIELKDFNEDPLTMISDLLKVTAVDEAGNVGFDTATPLFNEDDVTTTPTQVSSDTEPHPTTVPTGTSSDTEPHPTSGWELIPSLIILTMSVLIFKKGIKRNNKYPPSCK